MENYFSQPIVDSGGYAIYEKEHLIYFVNYGTRWVNILNFVSIIASSVLIANGIGQLFFNHVAGIILLALALPFLLILIKGLLIIKKRKNKNLNDLNKTAIIDLDNNQLLNKDGQILAPLKTVTFYKAWQLFDSARAVKAEWPNGAITIVKGLSLTGGSSVFFNYLIKKGLMKK